MLALYDGEQGVEAHLRTVRFLGEQIADVAEQTVLLVPTGHAGTPRETAYLQGWARALPTLLAREAEVGFAILPAEFLCPPFFAEASLQRAEEFEAAFLATDGLFRRWRRQFSESAGTLFLETLDGLRDDEGWPAWRAGFTLPEPRAVLEARRPAVARLGARLRAAFGFELPPTLDVFLAFHHALPPVAREAYDALVDLRFGGLLRLLDEPELVPREGLDLRLQDRFRHLPPELVPLLIGGTAGHLVGLWFDDVAKPPFAVVHAYSKDPAAGVFPKAATLLQWVREQLDGLDPGAFADPEAQRRPLRLVRELCDAFAPLDAEALDREGRTATAWRARKPALTCGMGIDAPGADAAMATVNAALDDLDFDSAEGKATVAALVQQAKTEPALALALGRALHHLGAWNGSEPLQPPALELLELAYRALGRERLAALARVHHAHRDLAWVDLFSSY